MSDAVQGFMTVLCDPSPISHYGGGTSTLVLGVQSPLTVVWASGIGITDTYQAGTRILSIYDQGLVLNGHDFAHLIFFVHNTAQPWSCHEADYATLPSLVASKIGANTQYAVFARVDGDQVYRIPQI